ncbi:Ral GTPase-activating protein subunit alpha-2, partial [Camelus dromedarius]
MGHWPQFLVHLFEIRCEGIRLFLLWLQALQTNCAEEQVLIFACLVPGFPAVVSSRGPCTLETLINPSPSAADAKVRPEEIAPLLPAVPGGEVAEDQTCFFLQILLKYMAIQAASLEWKNKENQETGFKFLFTLFRKYYLPHLFPSFTRLTNVYKPVLDIPHSRPKPVYVMTTRDNENIYSTNVPYMAARVVFIKWIVTFFLEKKYLTGTQNTKNGADVLPKIIQTVGGGAGAQERTPELDGGGAAEQDRGPSNSSTLSDRRRSSGSLCSVDEEHRPVYEMVQRILLSTRGYVNFVNEVFRQAFLLPSCDIAVTRKVVHVYRKWILQDKPVFMEEPDIKEAAQEDAEKLGFSETDTKEASSESSGHKRSSSWGRSYSFTSAVSRGCVTEEENRSVKAGAQAALQTLIVAWIRASLCVYVSRELWDDFLGVLSSLTEWDELISEWANIMDSLTVVLARTVYGVEMTNLPLDKLSEQKEKKQRGKGPKVENVQTGSSSEPKPVQENKGHVKKEHEGMTILVRRSSSPAELDLTDDSQQTQGKCRERQKSDSVSSDTALSYSTEAELALSPWPTCEEDPELSSPTDAATDSDARHWLQLSPTDASNLTDSSECLADDCSIVAGGTLAGWHPDSAAVLWRRVLGILGDVNNIQSPQIHARVFGYLYELWYKLAKIRDNLAVSLDNQSSPSPPTLTPPLRMFASWLFKASECVFATTLPKEYKEGKLQAYKLICAMMTRRQDVLPSSDFLVHCYLAMHLGLTSDDQ